MYKIFYYITCVCILALTSCGGGRQVAQAPKEANPYARKPLAVANEEQLQLDAMLIEAKVLQEAGQRERALEAYRKLLAQAPNYGGALYEVSRLHLGMGRMDSALAYADKAIGACDTNVWYHLHRAQCLEYMGKRTLLCQEWENIVRLKPNTLEYYYELSDRYVAAGDAAKAIEVLNRVERLVGVSEEVSLQKARLWEADGHPDRSVKEMEALAKALPNNKKYSSYLAETHLRAGNFAKARQYYDQALAADPHDGDLRAGYAVLLKTTGQTTMAYQELGRSLKDMERKPLEKFQLLVNFCTEEEYYVTHIGHTLPIVRELAREDTAALGLYLADLLVRNGNYAEASPLLERVLTSDSSNAGVWELLLACDMAEQDTAAVLRHGKRAIALFPLMHTAYVALGEAARLQERYEECFAYYDKALDLQPNNPMVLNNYAFILGELKLRLNDALTMAKQALQLNPNDANVMDTYGWLLHIMGRDSEALPLLQKAVKTDKENATYQRHLKAVQNR